MAETVMRLRLHHLKAGRAIDAARGDKNTLGPQGHRRVAGFAGEAEAFGSQRAADAKATCRGLDDQEPELRHRVAAPDQHYRADRLAVELGDPAALALGVMGLEKLRGDLGD